MLDEKDDLNKLMAALGAVVVAWGMVEDVVRHLMRDIVFREKTGDDVERIILSETPFRSQLDILRKVAHVRRPNSDWFNRLTAVTSELSNSMHAERNRLIHDLWEENDKGQVIKSVRGREETAVSRKGREWQLKITGERAVPVAEVEAFFEKVADHVDALIELRKDYTAWNLSEARKNLFSDLRDRTVARAAPEES